MQGCELWTLSAPAPAQEAQAQAQVERQLKFISFLLFSSKDPNLISSRPYLLFYLIYNYNIITFVFTVVSTNISFIFNIHSFMFLMMFSNILSMFPCIIRIITC